MADITFDKDAFWERAKALLGNIKVRCGTMVYARASECKSYKM